MRVRAAAGLHFGNLLGLRDVGDVEDADALDSVRAGRWRRWPSWAARGICGRICRRRWRWSRTCGCWESLAPTVEPSVGRFYRHEQKMAIDRDVALPAGADHGGEQLDVRRAGDVIKINAAVVPHKQGGAVEGQVGVGAAVVGARTALGTTWRRSARGWRRRSG